jgi:hypothetical protein
VTDAQSAYAAAESIGGEVAIKIDSPDIAHKTEVGGVKLGVVGGKAAHGAFQSIMDNCRRAAPTAKLRGAIVQEMIPPGVEIIVGVKNDDAFGPVIVVGLGGIFTELLRDTVTALAPFDERSAHELLGRLRGSRLLDGFRGTPAVDRSVLAQAVSRISYLAYDNRKQLIELDVNPLICRGDNIIAVDGWAALRQSSER